MMNKDDTINLKGKLCLVTGSSRGIGFQVADQLAGMGAHIIMVSHDKERGEDALARIKTAHSPDSAEFIRADLSVIGQMRAVCDEVKKRHDHLDVLVNDAGGFFIRRETTPDGLEMTFALNHMNYFVITLLLLDLLRKSDIARIVVVASESHRGAKIHFSDLQLEKSYSGFKAYGQSKLANILFTYELARRLEGEKVTVNCLHPGFVNTHIGKRYWFAKPFMDLIYFFKGKSAEEGAETPVYLASSRAVEGVSGKYFIDKRPVRSSPASYDEETARKLWQVSLEISGISEREIPD